MNKLRRPVRDATTQVNFVTIRVTRNSRGYIVSEASGATAPEFYPTLGMEEPQPGACSTVADHIADFFRNIEAQQ